MWNMERMMNYASTAKGQYAEMVALQKANP